MTDPELNLQWWDALELLYCADRALWEMFVGDVKTRQGNKQYAQFREMLARREEPPGECLVRCVRGEGVAVSPVRPTSSLH